MLNLTPENVPAYLRSRGFIGSGPAHVEPLGWGISNVVFRVQTPERTFVLKQSRPQLRTRDAWFSDLDRVYREQEVMQTLFPLLPPLTVPEVLFSDRENYVLAMSHAPMDATVWKDALLKGQVDLAVGERAGQILGQMHETTARNTSLVEPFSNRTAFFQLRTEPFYLRLQKRLPDVADAIAPIVEQLQTVKEALCHGDYSPKNILVHRQGFTLVDYETAHYGDPTMDLGFFLSHLLLKAARNDSHRQRFFELTRSFWRGYGATVQFRPLGELQRRGIQHLAVCALTRIDGTSPVDYLPEEPKRNIVRRLCRCLLWEKPETWEAVITLWDHELANLNQPHCRGQ